ncbi:hypothetical protein A9Q83_18455 [Alphaproteobacteria bacterium 46_93_T64]|nr:hypothetical protein A9Q83_18455 [Alphaproteobacteria bacterium 46_93_T64]
MKMNTLTTKMKCAETAAPENVIQSILVESAKKISLWHGKSRQRQTLSNLTNDQLCDIGLSAKQAKSEYTKVFWQ